jgi:hypothetical protein
VKEIMKARGGAELWSKFGRSVELSTQSKEIAESGYKD